MRISPEIDLGRSLRQVFGNKADFTAQIEQDCARQSDTTSSILRRFVSAKEGERRELIILADEVGLGKTYVALAVATSILDAIRRGEAPDGLPSNKPVALVLVPSNEALFNKWMREAEAFKTDCARKEGELKWLQIRSPIDKSSKGNMINLSQQMRDATRSQPILLIAKQSVFGAALHSASAL
jgi:Type III restriction enzyme, res subunit